jgi:hypothetical protein
VNELWKQLWLPILVIALVLWWALDPMYKKFRANRQKEEKRPAKCHLR